MRRFGNDAKLTDLAVAATTAIAAGHAFVVMLRNGFAVSVLNQVKAVPEVCNIFYATADSV